MALSLTDAARTALARSNRQYTTRIEIVRGSTVLASTDDGTIKILEGEVSFDANRDIIGEHSFQAVIDKRTEAALVPTTTGSILSPISPTSVRVSPGIRLSSGSFEYVTIGLFDLAETIIDEEAGGGLRLECQTYDRFRGLDRADFTDVVTIAAGTNYVTAIQSLITPVYPGISFISTPTDYTTPLLTWDVGESRLEAVTKMAASIGYEVRFNPDGACIIRPVPLGVSAAWTYTEGTDAVLVSTRRRLTDERTYNGVIYRGESLGAETAPVQGEAWDTDPTSPTYYDPANPGASTYGPVPFFQVSEFITTSAQASDAASARLPNVKGLVEQVEVLVAMNPAMQEGDVVALERARTGITGVFAVESIRYNLETPMMLVKMKERRL